MIFAYGHRIFIAVLCVRIKIWKQSKVHQLKHGFKIVVYPCNGIWHNRKMNALGLHKSSGMTFVITISMEKEKSNGRRIYHLYQMQKLQNNLDLPEFKPF